MLPLLQILHFFDYVITQVDVHFYMYVIPDVLETYSEKKTKNKNKTKQKTKNKRYVYLIYTSY